MLAKKYTNQNPTGWFMSEKFDGVRAIWDGELLLSRSGKVINAPSWFTDRLPLIPLDGELWEGIGEFQQTVGKIRSLKGDWSNIKFMIFDAPTNETCANRLQSISVLPLPSYCKRVIHTLCRSKEHLLEFENAILSRRGEGVMLRDPAAVYEHKRSKYLLKVKRFKSDEAQVIGHIKGTGRNSERLGALICKWDGKVFQLGTGFTDELRDNPPPIGSTVTFTFFEATDKGIPRFPAFVAVRDYE